MPYHHPMIDAISSSSAASACPCTCTDAILHLTWMHIHHGVPRTMSSCLRKRRMTKTASGRETRRTPSTKRSSDTRQAHRSDGTRLQVRVRAGPCARRQHVRATCERARTLWRQAHASMQGPPSPHLPTTLPPYLPPSLPRSGLHSSLSLLRCTLARAKTTGLEAEHTATNRLRPKET